MDINYWAYLDSDEWPSESLAAVVDPATGEFRPAVEAVYDMVPQKAVAALHKLIRWAHSQAIDVQGEYEMERRVRVSMLGRLLARKALRVEDFELYQEHGVDRKPLSNQGVARVLVGSMVSVTDGDSLFAAIPPRELGQLASDVAVDINNNGYVVYREQED